jgi:DNA-binding GntR family transcriptional regulator
MNPAGTVTAASVDFVARISDPRAYRRIHAALRDQISSGHLADGARLHIDTIAAEFQVSRDTVQSALKLLESDNLIFRVPGLGWHVGQPEEDDDEEDEKRRA